MTTQTVQTVVNEMPERMLQARASQAYATQSRQVMEEELILGHLPLVRHIVSKVTDIQPGRIDVDDLISAGTLGLVRAARAYDTSRNAEFKTYAYIRVRGAVIDEMRSRSFTPSAKFSQLRRIQSAHQKLATEFGRPPSDSELAAEVGISTDQLYRMLQEVRRMHFLSIHGLVTEGESSLGSLIPPDKTPAPDVQAERREMAQKLSEAIKELPERDRMILLLYYDKDLTMKETAQVLDITESRVSQLHASALFKLSMKLKGPDRHDKSSR